MNTTITFIDPVNKAEIDIPAGAVLANEVIFPTEFNLYNVHIFLIHNEYGYIAAVWASSAQDALDRAVNSDLLNSCLIATADLPDFGDDVSYLGNASEPFDLSNIGITEVYPANQPLATLLRFAEARGAGAVNLDQ